MTGNSPSSHKDSVPWQTVPEAETYTFTVESGEQGRRLDVFLAAKAPSLSRSRIQHLIEEGHVRIASVRAVKGSRKLRIGETVGFRIPPAAGCDVRSEDIPLQIVYEDEAMVVVDKPAGMVVHPGAGNATGTLVNALLHRCRDLSGVGGFLRPGIVHRLDKETSGLIVVAKSDEAHHALAAQFKRREVCKTYRALVWGDLKHDEGVIDLPIGRHPVERKRMSTRSRKGREAVTRWRVTERYGIAAFLDVILETGRTHQIRVHLASLGHPVMGDKVYGAGRTARFSGDASFREQLLAMKRQALHAAELRLRHPVRGEEMSFAAPLPEDMAALRDFLRFRAAGTG